MQKIPSLFVPGSKGREVDPDQAWIFDEYVTATRMWDGLCYAIIKGIPYRHLVTATLTPASIVCGTDSGQWYVWEPVTSDDSLFWQVWEDYDRYIDMDWSYELIGPSVHGNPEHATNHVLKPHGRLTIDALKHPTPESIRAYIEAVPVEGVVFWENTEDQMCRKVKVQHGDFGRPRRSK